MKNWKSYLVTAAVVVVVLFVLNFGKSYLPASVKSALGLS